MTGTIHQCRAKAHPGCQMAVRSLSFVRVAIWELHSAAQAGFKAQPYSNRCRSLITEMLGHTISSATRLSIASSSLSLGLALRVFDIVVDWGNYYVNIKGDLFRLTLALCIVSSIGVSVLGI